VQRKSTKQSFVGDEAGSMAIEYGMIALLVSVFIVYSVVALGGSIKGTFNTIDGAVTSANQK
jgi:Flp pilus assembly pilin Flp